jgi:hypothetical protein
MAPRRKSPPSLFFWAWWCLVPFVPQDLGFLITSPSPRPRLDLHRCCKTSWSTNRFLHVHAVRNTRMFDDAAKGSATKRISPLASSLLSWQNRCLVKPVPVAVFLSGSSEEGEIRRHENGRHRRHKYTVKDDPAFPYKLDLKDGRYTHARTRATTHTHTLTNTCSEVLPCIFTLYMYVCMYMCMYLCIYV